ncbi:MAG: FhaA domain-containing protein, partial [Candidatus Limnocylindrales bacterium]
IAVPARYRVRLHPSDLADVAARAGGAEEVAVRLAENALAFARSHGYHLAGRPEIWLVSDPVVDRGQVEVDIVRMGSPSASVPPDPSPSASAAASAPEPPAAAPTSGPPAPAPVPASVPAPAVPAAPPAAEPPGPVIPLDPGPAALGIRGDGTHTLVFRRPSPQPARAILRVFGPDGQERTIEVDGIPLTIGRSNDNVLVLVDGRVSRRHGRLQARRGTLVYTDLGSTNGSRVNGIRVDEIVLGEGDRLQIGDTVMVVESLPD